MKEKTFAINNELSLSLEVGSIEKLVVQIPWTQLHTGLINTLVENVQLVLQLNILNNDRETEQAHDSFAQDLKLVRVSIDYRLLAISLALHCTVLLSPRYKQITPLLHTIHHYHYITTTLTQDMLEKEELRMLGESTTDSRTWFARNSDTILRSFLTKMMANCTLTARKYDPSRV